MLTCVFLWKIEPQYMKTVILLMVTCLALFGCRIQSKRMSCIDPDDYDGVDTCMLKSCSMLRDSMAYLLGEVVNSSNDISSSPELIFAISDSILLKGGLKRDSIGEVIPYFIRPDLSSCATRFVGGRVSLAVMIKGEENRVLHIYDTTIPVGAPGAPYSIIACENLIIEKTDSLIRNVDSLSDRTYVAHGEIIPHDGLDSLGFGYIATGEVHGRNIIARYEIDYYSLLDE